MTITRTSRLSYDEAVAALNSLQTNAVTLARVRKERQRNVHLSLPQTRRYLERSGMSLTDLDSLQVIHVSGTKGKGSTCAFCESILRQSGLKTGFFSSPHLVSVTERIRINGQPIEPDLFTHHFWRVYDAVCRGRAEDDRPPYFKFLTILALNIFWKEAVDVAVLEVGIGGEFDCTNIVRQPVVTGITALGLDHTSLLGGDIQDIAWHKAGIMKPGVACYVDPQQSYPATLEVIKRRGVERGALYTALPAPLESHGWDAEGGPPRLGLAGEVQSHNAALALALAQHFLSVRAGEQPPQPELQPGTPLPRLPGLSHNLPGLSNLAAGLAATVWPGRSHLVTRPGLQLYLDGAHTEESVAACCQWFSAASSSSGAQAGVFRLLLFNATGDRDPGLLLAKLAGLQLDWVVFCTNLSRHQDSADQQNFTTNQQMSLARCEEHRAAWAALDTGVPCTVIPCINTALEWSTAGREPALNIGRNSGAAPGPPPPALAAAPLIQILVTGSLHLVGGVLGCIRYR